MHVTVVRPSELGEGEAAQWRAFQDSSLIMSHPFLSLSYAKAWDIVTDNARVAVVEDGGRIQAFIPYAIGDRKIAAAIGGTHTSVDGIVSSGSRLDMRAVVRKSGLRGWRFSRAPVDQQVLDPYRYRGARDRRTVSCINLVGDFDKYLSDLRDGVKKRIVKAERSRRALERAAGPVRFDWRNQGTEHFAQLIEWKSAQ
jgi:CelD/BcsL family acetyltransferase involved in cellulose biosynthesis